MILDLPLYRDRDIVASDQTKRNTQVFYWLKFLKKPLFEAHTIPLRTKTVTGKETPLCSATDNGISLPVGVFVLSGIAYFDAHEEESE